MNLPTFLPFPKDRLNMMSLYDLLLGFFYFYVHQFRFEFDVLSVRRGQILPIDKVKWEQAQQRMSQYGGLHGADREMDAQTPSYTYDNAYMFIEEPFNRTNVSRSVYDPEVFQGIKKVFKEAYDELTTSHNPFSIFN
ncbi:poly(A) RNA polymerase GLD2-A-like [Watersipora subatra]|uniref:poly(A) RNA polymerase GLD2-A-like n=1 Tax=Watersipora subatra TaxID=2589382 RepID=UPI00355B0512